MANTTDWGVDADSPTFPPFAGPDEPSIRLIFPPELGETYPDLVAFYAPDVVVAAIILQDDSLDYDYIALVNPLVGLTFTAMGGMESVGLNLTEAWRVTPGVGEALAQRAKFTVNGRLEIDNIPAPRAYVGNSISQANSAPIGAQTVVLTSVNPVGGTSVTFISGRAYMFAFGARWTASVNNTVVIRFQRTNVAGTVILEFSFELTAAAGAQTRVGFAPAGVFSANDITVDVVFSIGATAGTVTMNGAATIPRWFAIYDIGDVNDFPNIPTIPVA